MQPGSLSHDALSQSSASPYDAVPYPSGVFAQTHPDRLGTIGRLFGLRPAPVERARVVEFGCGDATNLIAMAITLPQGRFYGVDLAAAPIRRGRQMIQALGLGNIRLEQMDLLQAPEDLGEFDYIIAHGLYSWVPEPVREKLLALCGAHLSEQGIAYISYNAYPGNHLRELTRGMLQYHLQQFSEPQEQVRQARTLMKFLSEAKPKPNQWQQLMAHEFERIQQYPDAGLFHDDLSPTNQPFYFHEFIRAAERHGLRFLAEADITDMQVAGLTEEATGVMRKLEQCNLVAREQYLDFVCGRAFRQTLLCHQERAPNAELAPERAEDLFAAADTRPVSPAGDWARGKSQDFQRGKAIVATSTPVVKAALMILGEIWPSRIGFPELLVRSQERVVTAGGQPEGLGGDGPALGEFLVRSYLIGFVDLHAWPSCFVTGISERPLASALVRRQLENGPVACSVRHQTLRIEDSLGRALLKLLDGTRDQNALIDALTAEVLSGAAELFKDGQPVTHPDQVRTSISAGLESNLRRTAELGLLVG